MSTDIGVATKTGTKFPEIFAGLARPFEPGEVKHRPGTGGRPLSYITARTAQIRLDEVVGPENWDFEVQPWGQTALIGTLTIHLPDGSTVRKSDVGGKADMTAADDSTKSAASDCLKRCAALVGVGRYLYQDGFADYGDGDPRPSAPPTAAAPSRARGFDDPRPSAPPTPAHGNAPRNGRGLFAWVKEQEQQHNVGLFKYLQAWCKLKELPDRFVDCTDADVAEIYAEGCRKLASLGGQEPPGDNGNGPDERLDRQKKELRGLICRLADNDRPDQHTVGRILDEIAGEGDGERIDSIRDCRDGRLLGQAIAAANMLLDRQAAV